MLYINVLAFQIAKQASCDSFTSFGAYFEKTITHRFCMRWTQVGPVLFDQFQQLNHASLKLRWHIKNLVFNPSVKINSPSHRTHYPLGLSQMITLVGHFVNFSNDSLPRYNKTGATHLRTKGSWVRILPAAPY